MAPTTRDRNAELTPPLKVGDRSFYPNLDHLRWMAAFFCTFGHVAESVLQRRDEGASLIEKLLLLTIGLSHPALVSFFVLSGFLVGGKALRLVGRGSSPEDRHQFIVARIVRMTIVLWPTLLLCAVVMLVAPRGATASIVDWDAVSARSSISGWIGTAFYLNGLLAPKLAIDSPLWSLAFEWTYYVAWSALVYVAARDVGTLGKVVIGYAITLGAIGLFLNVNLIWMMGYCVIGALASRVRTWRGPCVSGGVFVAATMFAAYHTQAIWTDGIAALATALLLADSAVREARIAPALGVRLAGFSYSLYAIHWPVLLLAIACLQRIDLIGQRLPVGLPYAATVLALMIVCYVASALFARLTEYHTDRIRAWLMHPRRFGAAGSAR